MVAVKAMVKATETVVIAIVMVGEIADNQTGVLIQAGKIVKDGVTRGLKGSAMIQISIVSIAETRSVVSSSAVDEAVRVVDHHHHPGIGNRRARPLVTAMTSTSLPTMMEL